MKTEEQEDVQQTKGAFVASLRRKASQIKQDRATAIAEDTEVIYRRYIDNMKDELRKLRRDRRNSLDLSPDDVNSLVAGRDFNAEMFVKNDIQAGVSVRNLMVRIEIAEERYSFLFNDGEMTEDMAKSTAEVD